MQPNLTQTINIKTILLSISLGLALFPGKLLANELPPLPQTNAQNDYTASANSWWSWQVVDPDPRGLNCRISPEFRQFWLEDFRPGGWQDDFNIGEWSVVRRFPKQTVLIADNAPAGATIIRDERGLPWVKVIIDMPIANNQMNDICFVRANSKYIRPVKTSVPYLSF